MLEMQTFYLMITKFLTNVVRLTYREHCRATLRHPINVILSTTQLYHVGLSRCNTAINQQLSFSTSHVILSSMKMTENIIIYHSILNLITRHM